MTKKGANHHARVALIVDHPCRDLPGLVLVARQLCQEGVDCFLVPMNLQHQEIFSIEPDFVLLNFLRKSNETFVKGLADLGIPFGVLEDEGAVMQSMDAFSEIIASDSSVRRKVAFFCCWGPAFAAYVTRAGWFRPDQLSVTGSPRFDYYAQPWRKAVSQESARYLRNGSKLVLINGNFPVANPAFNSPEEELAMYQRVFKRDRETLVMIQETQRAGLQGLTHLTNRLAERFPEAIFIYRPHPFERLSTYSCLLNRRENLHLVREGTVDAWIFQSEAVVQRSCSTAIETAISGIPALSPLWIPTLRQPLPESVSVGCAGEKEFIKVLSLILEGRFEIPSEIFQRLKRLIKEWYFQIDGKAHKRVAENILRNLPAASPWRNLSRGQRSFWTSRLQGNSLRSMIGRFRQKFSSSTTPSPQRLWENSEKFFGRQEVQKVLDSLSRCNQEKQDGSYRQIFAQETGTGRTVALSTERS